MSLSIRSRSSTVTNTEWPSSRLRPSVEVGERQHLEVRVTRFALELEGLHQPAGRGDLVERAVEGPLAALARHHVAPAATRAGVEVPHPSPRCRAVRSSGPPARGRCAPRRPPPPAPRTRGSTRWSAARPARSRCACWSRRRLSFVEQLVQPLVPRLETASVRLEPVHGAASAGGLEVHGPRLRHLAPGHHTRVLEHLDVLGHGLHGDGSRPRARTRSRPRRPAARPSAAAPGHPARRRSPRSVATSIGAPALPSRIQPFG